MHVIHGTWIPEDTHEFIQKGAFYLWVETDTPMGESRSRAGTVHPRHLGQSALSTFLTEKLGLREFAPGALARTLSTKYFLLPTSAGKQGATTREKRAKNSPSFEIHPAWELLSDTYETTIQRYVAAMPGVCAAGLNSPDEAGLLDKEPLLRHFSECLLHDIVTGTPFTGKFDDQIANTFLYRGVYPYRPVLSQASPEDTRSEEHTSELQSQSNLVCRLL